jgi:hypothetical protein
MSASLIQLADALAAALADDSAAGLLPRAITPVRLLRPRYDVADLRTLRVTLVPGEQEETILSRAASQIDQTVDIGIQEKLGPDQEATIAAGLELTEAIIIRLRRRRLELIPAPASPAPPPAPASCIALANSPAYWVEHVEQFGVFTSVIVATFRRSA